MEHTEHNAEQDEALKADADAGELGKLGYAQELFRKMGGFSNFALSFSIISIVTGIAQYYGYSMGMGGPVSVSLGWPLVAFFAMFVALSLAELSSGFPTSGAMYHWSTRLGGKTWGWYTAWFNLVGLITLLAAVDYVCAQVLTPLLGIPATQTAILLMYGAILISHGLINHVGIRLVAWLNQASVTVHMLAVAVVVGGLLLFAPHQPVQFFVHAENYNGQYPSYLTAFVLGLLMSQWVFTGYDASAQVAEETVDPRHRVPWGMVISVASSALFGYMMLFALTISVRDVKSVLATTDAAGNVLLPIIPVMQTALGPQVGTAVLWLILACMWFCGLASVTSVSRTVYAFSRDEGLPLSVHWKRVSPRFGTPSRAIWLVIVLGFLLLLYSLRDPNTVTYVTSMSVVAIYTSYILPILLNRLNRKPGGIVLRGPWNLGPWSELVANVAIAWTAFIGVVLMLPPNQMAGYGLGVTVTLLTIWYVASENRRFLGPSWLAEGLDFPEAAGEMKTVEVPNI